MKFTTFTKRKVRSSKVFGIPNQIRQLAHYTSDGIYESITGIKGIAATRLLYVNEIKDSQLISTYKLMLADSDGANEKILLSSSEPIISPHHGHQMEKELHMYHLRQELQKCLYKI